MSEKKPLLPSGKAGPTGNRTDILATLKRLREMLRQPGSSDPSTGDDQTYYHKMEKTLAHIEEMLGDDIAALEAVIKSGGGDKIAITGDVMPGSNVGAGVTHNQGGVAGRDHVTSDLHIAHVDNLYLAPDGGPLETPPRRGSGPRPAPVEAESLSEEQRLYLKWLVITANRLPLGELDMHVAGLEQPIQELNLETIYISLDTIHMWNKSRQTDGSPEQQRIPVLDPVIRNRRVVLLGDPGSGKSTFLNYMTLCLAGARLYPRNDYLVRLNVPGDNERRAATWKHGPLLPIKIDLRDLAVSVQQENGRSGTGLIWQFIEAELKSNNLSDFASEMQDELRRGHCLVMLDGLDEVTDPHRRRMVVDAISSFADHYSDNRYLATCRLLSYTNPAWQLPGFPPVVLAPLSKPAIDTFINNWYATMARIGQAKNQRWASQRAEELREAAGELVDLAENPMLLTVMAIVHTYKGKLPRERARLYQDCTSLLLWEWKQPPAGRTSDGYLSVVDELDTREERLMSGLCCVAYEAHRAAGNTTGAASIRQPDILRILKDYLDGDWGKAQKFCDYVEERAGLLVSKGQDAGGERVYGFPHRGFQEFLAGRHLVSGRDFARRVADLALQGDAWREVILLAVGHLVYNNQEVITSLDAVSLLCPERTPADDAGWRAVWLAGEILGIVGRSAAEQDEHVGKVIVPRVIRHLVGLLDGGHLAAHERAQAADILGILGDPRPGVSTKMPDMLRFPGGKFTIGEDDEAHSVMLRPFWLSRFAVTNFQFRLFIADQGYRKPQYWTAEGLEWRKRSLKQGGLAYDPSWGIANRPVVKISWHEALAYTRWLREVTGKPFRLPTEAEWESAAAGSERRRYPFGKRARHDATNTREAGIGHTTSVGIFPDDRTPEGLYDMGGNTWEWCSSLDKPYPYRYEDGREDPSAPGKRILRSSSYDSPRRVIHCTHRHALSPDSQAQMNGFRVAMDD